MPARDSQRKRLYLAEDSVDLRGCVENAALPTVPEMQAFVDKLLAEAWSRRRWGNVKVEVKDGRGRSRAGGARKTWRHGPFITMPAWSRTKLLVCHELAHALADANDAAHGPEYARRYLELVEHTLGEQAAKLLRERMVQCRVKIGPPLVLKDLQPLPEPKKLWRIEATDVAGTTVTALEEATTLRRALIGWLNTSTAAQAGVVALSARRVRRSVKATGS